LPKGLAKDQGIPSGDAPQIPQEKPSTSWERTAFFRAALNWIARNSLAGDIYVGTMNNVEWLKEYHDILQAGRDEPKTFQELQQGLREAKAGYDVHHVVEKAAAKDAGFAAAQIEGPENLVRVPRIAHFQITGWYMAKNDEFDGQSPRQYLAEKSWEERRQVGLYALVKFKVLKP
jgi:hypothetical protein